MNVSQTETVCSGPRSKHRKRHHHADSPRDAHLLAMCAKLAYEDRRIIADVLRRCCDAVRLSRFTLSSVHRGTMLYSPCLIA